MPLNPTNEIIERPFRAIYRKRKEAFSIDSRITIHLDYDMALDLAEFLIAHTDKMNDYNRSRFFAFAKQLQKLESNDEISPIDDSIGNK